MEWVLFLVINITLIEFEFNSKIKTNIKILLKIYRNILLIMINLWIETT